MKPIVIRLHVNRNELRKGVDAWPWTIHTSRACIRARKVHVRAELTAEYHPERKNPKLFLTGRAFVHDLGEGVFEISSNKV